MYYSAEVALRSTRKFNAEELVESHASINIANPAERMPDRYLKLESCVGYLARLRLLDPLVIVKYFCSTAVWTPMPDTIYAPQEL